MEMEESIEAMGEILSRKVWRESQSVSMGILILNKSSMKS